MVGKYHIIGRYVQYVQSILNNGCKVACISRSSYKNYVSDIGQHFPNCGH